MGLIIPYSTFMSENFHIKKITKQKNTLNYKQSIKKSVTNFDIQIKMYNPKVLLSQFSLKGTIQYFHLRC